jgi:hypothetical protein
MLSSKHAGIPQNCSARKFNHNSSTHSMNTEVPEEFLSKQERTTHTRTRTWNKWSHTNTYEKSGIQTAMNCRGTEEDSSVTMQSTCAFVFMGSTTTSAVLCFINGFEAHRLWNSAQRRQWLGRERIATLPANSCSVHCTWARPRHPSHYIQIASEMRNSPQIPNIAGTLRFSSLCRRPIQIGSNHPDTILQSWEEKGQTQARQSSLKTIICKEYWMTWSINHKQRRNIPLCRMSSSAILQTLAMRSDPATSIVPPL